MKELTATHKEGWRIRTLIPDCDVTKEISALQARGFVSFSTKTIKNVNPKDFNWKEVGGKWLSPN